MTFPPGTRLFCFGFGYSAAALARALAGESVTVAGTTRDAETAERLHAVGVAAFPFDGREPVGAGALGGALDGATHILASVPPDAAGDPVLRHHADVLAALGPRWIGYLSTTGVYGTRDGGWVDEGSALRPTSDRARRRVQAELGWQRFADRASIPVQVFRLAGIYGPGRSVLDDLRAGRARRIDRPGHLFSRIHVDDIAGVLAAAMARPETGPVFNVCDDAPAAQAEVVAFGAELLGIVPPPLVSFAEAALSDMARSFWTDNKRVCNDRMKQELGYALKYPTYREGLRAVLAAGG